jgi:predicted MFS family arabinose efflux permease
MAIMMVSAVFSFWSVRLFPGRSTLGFTATLLAMAAGSVLGPVLAGLLSAAQGPVAMFLAAGLPPAAVAIWFGLKLRQPRPRLPPA